MNDSCRLIIPVINEILGWLDKLEKQRMLGAPDKRTIIEISGTMICDIPASLNIIQGRNLR